MRLCLVQQLKEERSFMQLQISELSLQSPLLHRVRYNKKARDVLQRRVAETAREQQQQLEDPVGER